MPPKRKYEVGELSNSSAITDEAKARRRAYLEMWRNMRYSNRDDEVNPPPPQTTEEHHQVDTPMPPSTEPMQDSNEDIESEQEENYIITSTGKRVQFKWGRCIGTGPDPEEEEEEDTEEEDPEENLVEVPKEEQQQDAEESEEDPKEGDPEEEDPEEAPKENWQGNVEESEEDPEENWQGNVEESKEDPEENRQGEPEELEEEVGNMEEGADDELAPIESSEDEEPWEIPVDENEILEEDEDEDEGDVDEPMAIERAPEKLKLNDSDYEGFPSDDDLH